ncbi:hypothetical protein [Rhizobium lusitanum]|uniref:hypothetical protein n=1 Tax=Rhizobium lusitanum TaxID=293958 RepID=UPI00195D869C|nr:hypothetical protein [Rhizobium lusitanum]MBM7046086.1 hypothetical protein [Rhizobium lusitanum]
MVEKPIAHLVWLQGRRAADDVEDYYEVARPGDKSVDGSDPFPVYASPSDDAWTCAARKQGTTGGNDPADCNWPMCGCDPYADKVIAALEESGALSASPSDAEQHKRTVPDIVAQLGGRPEDLRNVLCGVIELLGIEAAAQVTGYALKYRGTNAFDGSIAAPPPPTAAQETVAVKAITVTPVSSSVAPERLWLGAANEDGEHYVWFDPDEGGTLYLRANLDPTKTAIAAAKAAYWHETHNGGGYSDKCYEAAIRAALVTMASEG